MRASKDISQLLSSHLIKNPKSKRVYSRAIVLHNAFHSSDLLAVSFILVQSQFRVPHSNDFGALPPILLHI